MLDVILLLALMLVVSGVGFAVRARFVEQSRVANAFEYLEDIQVSQQLHYVQTGKYATHLDDLDLSIPSPAYFAVGEIRVSSADQAAPGWELQLQRAGAAPLFGAYAITFNGLGFDARHSSVETSIVPHEGQRSRFHQVLALAVLR